MFLRIELFRVWMVYSISKLLTNFMSLTYNSEIWTKKTVNLRRDEIDRLNTAAKQRGYRNLHEAMRSLTLSLLENPTTA